MMAAHPPDDSVLRNAPKLVPDEPVTKLRVGAVHHFRGREWVGVDPVESLRDLRAERDRLRSEVGAVAAEMDREDRAPNSRFEGWVRRLRALVPASDPSNPEEPPR